MQEKKIKKKYEKPELKSIHLLAEEVLGVGCKAASAAPGGNYCAEAPCNAEGS